MNTSNIKDTVINNKVYRSDGGTRAIASNIATAYGYEIPSWVVARMLTAITIKNKILKSDPDSDLRVHDMKSRYSSKNPNQLLFNF